MRRHDVAGRPGSRKAEAWQKARPTVESVEQRILLTTFTVSNTSDVIAAAGQPLTAGTLRTAIIQANADTAGPTIINFDIAATGAVQTISPTQALPAITRSMTIDGTTERNYAGSPLIEINGSGAGTGVTGLTIAAGNSTVQGLTINRFTGNGIALTTAGGNTIAANYIGTTSGGAGAAANALDGILVAAASDGNTINNNLISGNTGNGINLNGMSGGSVTTTTANNVITGNFVGVARTGTTVLSNQGVGILLQNAPSTTVGGTLGGATRNVISGNGTGIEVDFRSDNSVFAGNYIGTDVTGTAALGNSPGGGVSGVGVSLRGSSNLTIGGTTLGAGNVISGGGTYGINSLGAGTSAIAIQGNLIGTDASGARRLGNALAGIQIVGGDTVTIGGTDPNARNVISGNTGQGITATGATNLIVQGNYIGVASNGVTALGNMGDGVSISAGSNGALVGGTDLNAGNIIANNGLTYSRSGVVVGAATGVSVLSNSIYNNSVLGIRLNGANNGQVAPVLTSAVSMGTTSTYTGTLNAPAGTYNLQFFSSPTLNASGAVEGQIYVGQASVMITAGSSAFTATVDSGFLPGNYISATATNANGGTSQFSTALINGTGTGQGTIAPRISVAPTTATVNAGQNVTYTFTISNVGSVTNTGVNFSDVIPAGTTFVSGTTSSGVPVVVTNGVANAAIDRINSGASVTVTIVLAAGPASYTNTGLVTSTVPTVVASDNVSASSVTNVTASSDLAVSVVGPLNPVAIGDTVTYQATISNNGPSAAVNVTFSDTLPANTTFVSISSDVAGATFTQTGGTITGTIGTLAAGALANIVLVVSTNPSTPAQVFDTVAVATDTPDSDSTNNTATSNPTTVVPSADLSIVSETADPISVLAGQPVTFTIVVVNSGPSTATGVTLVDTLPAGLTFVSGSSPGGTVSLAGGLIVAPVGTLAAGQQTTVTLVLMATMIGTFSDSAVISATESDPNAGNNSSSATISAVALSDLSVTFANPVGTGNVGDPLLFTATVSNNGPSPAANVQFVVPLPDGFTFVSGGMYQTGTNNLIATTTLVNGNIVAGIFTLAVGASEQLSFTLLPTQPGTFSLTANVSGTNPDLTPDNNSATVTTTVLLPSPVLAFDMGLTTVNETAGTATILIDRIGSTGTQVSVRFSTTTGGNATPGLDYTPISTIVTFPVGVSQVAVTVPVLPNPTDRLNELVALQLDSPTGGAILPGGAASITATLQIINLDPDLVGPTITDLKLFGPTNAITGVEIDTDGGLDPATATLASNYSFLAMGGVIPAGTVIPAGMAVYDPTTGAILVIPSMPLPANELFTIIVNGTSGTPVSDIAGNPINSNFGTVAGSNFGLTIARGKNLNYLDENGTNVRLRLTGPGTLDINRTIGGQLGRLQILGATNASTLSGSVSPRGRRTNIGVILGFGQFGVVKTRLTTPPFYVANRAFKNSSALVGPAAVDTLTDAPVAAVTTTTAAATAKKPRALLKAKAIARASHPHAALARSTQSRTNR